MFDWNKEDEDEYIMLQKIPRTTMTPWQHVRWRELKEKHIKAVDASLRLAIITGVVLLMLGVLILKSLC